MFVSLFLLLIPGWKLQKRRAFASLVLHNIFFAKCCFVGGRLVLASDDFLNKKIKQLSREPSVMA